MSLAKLWGLQIYEIVHFLFASDCPSWSVLESALAQRAVKELPPPDCRTEIPAMTRKQSIFHMRVAVLLVCNLTIMYVDDLSGRELG